MKYYNFFRNKISEMKTCFVLLFFVFVANNCFAQNKDYVFGLNAQYGFVWVHTAQVESVRGTKPQSLSFSFVKQYTDEKTYQKWHFFARQGVQFTYTDFHQPATSVLGKAYILSYILQPIIPLNENLNLVFTGTFGGAYLTRPYNANTNPGNQSYSESLNARLGLSAGLEYNIGENYALNLSADYNHISNGGMKQPNRGINYPTASIGIVYHTNSNRLPKYQKVKDDSWKQDNGIKKDFSIFFSPKDGYAKIDPSQAYNTGAWKQQWKALIGGNIQFSKRVSGVNALNLGVETYYDGAVASIKNNRGYPSSNMFVGLLAGNEFIIGRFLFSQQLGWYLYKNTKYLDTTYYNQNNGTNIYATPFYQRYGIKYRFSDNWFAGFNLLAHGKTADFFDFRLTYRLGRVRFSAERFE